jgi:hypothetical protein
MMGQKKDIVRKISTGNWQDKIEEIDNFYDCE